MSMLTQKAMKKINNDLEKFGFAEFQPGSFISTKENIIADQKGWGDEDPEKNTDFTLYLYWLTTDDGATPEGFDTIDELI